MTGPFAVLTDRELEVAAMLAAGARNADIAEHLEIRIKTVDTHRGKVMKKLGLSNNAQLAALAIREGLVSMHDLDLPEVA